MDAWPMDCASCLVMARNDTITPIVTVSIPVSVRFGALSVTRKPPRIARAMYMMFPTFPRIGISMKPARFARSLSSKSFWLKVRKSAFAASSWLKTWTTF